MDPQEGFQYIEPMRDEAGRSWDHAYNIFEDYSHPTVNGEFGWRGDSYASSDFDDVGSVVGSIFISHTFFVDNVLLFGDGSLLEWMHYKSLIDLLVGLRG